MVCDIECTSIFKDPKNEGEIFKNAISRMYYCTPVYIDIAAFL